VGRIVRELESIKTQQVTDEKTRQEIISLRIENETRSFFWTSLLSTLGPLATLVGALLGGWIGLRKYIETREKEQNDQAAADLRATLQNLVSKEPRERAVGIVGLQHYLTPEKKAYHLRALSALVTAARMEGEKESDVKVAVRIATEQAVKYVGEEDLQRISWQSTRLKEVNLSGHRLAKLDFRDADLEDANLSRCDLSNAVFVNSRLNGARLDDSILRGANLSYADLAGASLVNAQLQNAVLHHAKVWGMDLRGADLSGAEFDVERMPWELIKNWRSATMDQAVYNRLIDQFGAAPKGPRVLMLMWEIPPLVAGGTWTACYHLVRNLRRLGGNITVVVPWEIGSILPSPFGREVEVVPLGMAPPRYVASPYEAWMGPYGFSSYGSISYSPYGGQAGPYGAPFYSPYGFSVYSPTVGLHGGSALLRLIEEFKERFVRFARDREFDVIHAHDWVTFRAAEAAARRLRKSWVAHFHSLEIDRRSVNPDPIIEEIEQNAASTANAVVVPSRYTAERLSQSYKVDRAAITVVPNSFSREQTPVSQMGAFESKRTVFLGRLAHQKGPDLFGKIAAEVYNRRRDTNFWVFGEGPEQYRLYEFWFIHRYGSLEWNTRGLAFSGASALVAPSRSEPFGMVVLEAMQHRVPVLYPRSAGVAEVINSGVRIDPEQTTEAAAQLERVLEDWNYWEGVVERQSEEISGYPDRGQEMQIIETWERV
jgi:glycosyltransferase involved in cell wall biosynthesis